MQSVVLHCFFSRLPQARFNPFVRVLMANSLTLVGKGTALLLCLRWCFLLTRQNLVFPWQSRLWTVMTRQKCKLPAQAVGGCVFLCVEEVDMTSAGHVHGNWCLSMRKFQKESGWYLFEPKLHYVFGILGKNGLRWAECRRSHFVWLWCI